MDQIAKFSSFVRDPDHIKAFYEVRARVFPEMFSSTDYPPNTLLVVQRMVRPEFLLEVEATAVRSA